MSVKKRVLLINPYYSFEEYPAPPLGLVSLATFIKEQGHEVKILDFVVSKYNRDNISKELKQFKPDFAGATAVTMNINEALRILKDIKTLDSLIKTIIGGPHATFDADNILKNNSEIDFIVRREGEFTIKDLLASKDPYSKNIPGISFSQDGIITHNDEREFIPHIDTLPLPDYSLINTGKYKALGTSINMITSRGCPFPCIFCVGSKMVGNKVRYLSVDKVVSMFLQLAHMGFKQINIADDLFTSHKKRCIEICDEIINRNIQHVWTAFARVDSIDKELLQKLKQAGCTTLCFGIESANENILKTVKKKINREKIERAFTLCNETGIIPMASYILGLPGETKDTIKETLAYADQLSEFYGFHILAPFPGTDVYMHSKNYNVNILHKDWDKYDANHVVLQQNGITSDEIIQVFQKFYKDIQKYVTGVCNKYNSENSITESEMYMVYNIEKTIIVQNLLMRDTIERFNSSIYSDSEQSNIEQFINFLINDKQLQKDHTLHDPLIIKTVEELFTAGALTIVGNRVVWCT